ncbi:MAG: hypothetical protein AB7S26_15905 [Sandaracinaceae bacterium]
MRAELAGSTIGVTLFLPGPVDTALVRRGRAVDPAQRDAEAAFLARRAVSMRRVQDAFMVAVRRGPPRVLVGMDYRLIDWLARLSPRLAAWFVARLARRAPF